MKPIKPNNKGYALILSFTFIIILLLTGVCLYTSISHLANELLLDETEYIKGYYVYILLLYWHLIPR